MADTGVAEYGGTGNDAISGTEGNDILHGGGGDDTISDPSAPTWDPGTDEFGGIGCPGLLVEGQI